MTKVKRRSIARLGRIAAHAQGRAHTYTREEAQRAGRKGGLRRRQPGIPDLKVGQH